jgi:hypothetical protein
MADQETDTSDAVLFTIPFGEVAPPAQLLKRFSHRQLPAGPPWAESARFHKGLDLCVAENAGAADMSGWR